MAKAIEGRGIELVLFLVGGAFRCERLFPAQLYHISHPHQRAEVLVCRTSSPRVTRNTLLSVASLRSSSNVIPRDSPPATEGMISNGERERSAMNSPVDMGEKAGERKDEGSKFPSCASSSPKSSDDNAMGSQESATATSSPSTAPPLSATDDQQCNNTKMPDFKSLFGNLFQIESLGSSFDKTDSENSLSSSLSTPKLMPSQQHSLGTPRQSGPLINPNLLFQRFFAQANSAAAANGSHTSYPLAGTKSEQSVELVVAVQPREKQFASMDRQCSVASESAAGAGTHQERKRSYPYTFQFCVLCQKNVHSSKLPCHIRQCHVGMPMFQCPQCDFTSTYSKNNVKSHMVSLHGLAGDPISYMDQYAGQVEEFMKRCFPHVRGRGRPVHGRVSPVPIENYKPPSHKRQRTSHASLSKQTSSGGGLGVKREAHNGSLAIQPPNIESHHGRPARHLLKQASMDDDNLTKRFGTGRSSILFGVREESAATLRLDSMLAQLMGGSAPNIYSTPFPNVAFSNMINPFNLYLHQLSELANSNGSTNMHHAPSADLHSSSRADPALSNSTSLQSGKSNKNNRRLAKTPFFKELSSSLDRSVSENELKTTESRKPVAGTPPSCFSLDTAVGHEAGAEWEDFAVNEPRYLPQSLKWSVLETGQIEDTVFDTFTNTSEIIEKLDLSQFESLVATNSLLNEEQLQKISNVRRQLGLKSFEIMFAVHRLDLHVLKLEGVKLVASIAPTSADIRRFIAYELSNSVTTLSDNEQFMMQLGKIDRLNEKLLVMRFMAEFNGMVAEMDKNIGSLVEAAKFLQNSSEFHTLIHLTLIIANLINGDFNAELVKGFRVSDIVDMCAMQLPSGRTFISLLADRVKRQFGEILAMEEKRLLLEDASRVSFQLVARQLQRFDYWQHLLDVEVGESGDSLSVNNFLSQCESESTRLRVAFESAQTELASMLKFFGEPIPRQDETPLQPNTFFAQISTFLSKLFDEVNKHTSL